VYVICLCCHGDPRIQMIRLSDGFVAVFFNYF